MIAVSAELAAAIERSQRRPLVRLLVDWDGDWYGPPGSIDDLSDQVQSLTVDRQLAGELPDAVSIVEGSAAAALQVTLAGAPGGLPAARYFCRHDPASPLFGRELLARPVVLDIGFGTDSGAQWVRRFTGRTRAFHTGSGATVRMQALDLRELLAAPVGPHPQMWDYHGFSATWLVSHVLRRVESRAGFVCAPRPSAAATVHVPMHGGLLSVRPLPPASTFMISSRYWPDTLDGSVTGQTYPPPTFLPGEPFVAASYAGTVPGGVVRGLLQVNGGHAPPDDMTSGRVELWARVDASTSPATTWLVAATFPHQDSPFHGVLTGVDGQRRLAFGFFPDDADRPDWTVTGPVLPTDRAWHALGIQWAVSAGTVTVTFRLDGATQVTASHTWPTGTSVVAELRHLYWRLPVADIAFTPQPGGAGWMTDTVAAINTRLDYSALNLAAVLDIDDRPAWDILRELAAAEQAVVAVDEHGRLHYRTASRLAETAGQTTARTVTATSAVTAAETTESIDHIRNTVTVTARLVSRADAIEQVLSSTERTPIAAGRVGERFYTLPNPSVDVDTTVFVYRPSDPQPAPTTTFVTVAFRFDGATTGPVDESLLQAVAARLDVIGLSTLRLRVTNPTGKTLYLATGRPDTPTVNVAGWPLRETRYTTTATPRWPAGEHPSITRYGHQRLTVPASPWIQRSTVADTLALRLATDLAHPRRLLSDLAIVADPRLQLGDRIRVVDPDGLALDGHFFIVAIREQYSTSTGYRQSVIARDATVVLAWNTGRWNQTTWGTTR